MIPQRFRWWLTPLCVIAFSLLTAAAGAAEWRSLFNGTDLTGWKVVNGTAPFVVENGAIVGTTVAGSPNSFLATEAVYDDFVFEVDVKQEVAPTNSGIQIRSESRADYMDGRVHGYQLEIDPSQRGWTGGIYDEARRGWLYPVDLNPSARTLYRFGEWNRIRIEAIGPSIRTWINDQPVAHVIDSLTPRGFIALQVHSVSNADQAGRRVIWRNLRIKTDDLSPAPVAPIKIRNLIPNHLSAPEAAQGWQLLWDGHSSRGWRGAGQETFPQAGWRIENGEWIIEGGKGGDIITETAYGAFELQLDFKLTTGANSGIKYFVEEKATPLGGQAVGLEYQLVDDEGHADAKQGEAGNRTLASLYDLIPRKKMPNGFGIVPKVDQWQHARIVAHPGGRVEHWLNGIQVLEYQRGSDDFRARVAASKYRDLPGFGLGSHGPILLQDHGDTVRFRSIKIRRLDTSTGN